MSLRSFAEASKSHFTTSLPFRYTCTCRGGVVDWGPSEAGPAACSSALNRMRFSRLRGRPTERGCGCWAVTLEGTIAMSAEIELADPSAP